MVLSATARYAIRLLFELKMDKPLSSAMLAEQIGIPAKTLEKIQAILKSHKLTESILGSKGGLKLLKPLSQISLGQIIELFDNGIGFAVCFGNKANDCPNHNSCSMIAAWHTVSTQIQKSLNNISLEHILQLSNQGQNCLPHNHSF